MIRWLAIVCVMSSIAQARVRRSVVTDPPRPRSAIPKDPKWFAWGSPDQFRVSWFPDRTTDHYAYDLFCPHSGEPNPGVIVVPDRDQVRDDAEGVAGTFAETGFVTLVVEPDQLDALVADLDAGRIVEPADPGCV